MADRKADDYPEHGDVLDRIAAFTDELTEILDAGRGTLDSPRGEPGNVNGDRARSRTADSSALFADCEKALRAVAAIPVFHPTPFDEHAGRQPTARFNSILGSVDELIPVSASVG